MSAVAALSVAVVALSALCTALSLTLSRTGEQHRKERDRLYRLAFAETPTERMSAIREERPPAFKRERGSTEFGPHKPEGL